MFIQVIQARQTHQNHRDGKTRRDRTSVRSLRVVAPPTDQSPPAGCRTVLSVAPGSRRRRLGHAGAGTGGAALERAALVLAHPAPDTRVLSGLERPLEALVNDVATAADRLRVFDLQQCRPGVPDREEQLRVLIAA